MELTNPLGTKEGPKFRDSSGESRDIFERCSEKLPNDLFGVCLEKLPNYEDVIRAKLVSKYFKESIESYAFYRLRGIARPVEASLTSLYFFIKYGHWQCSGFDLTSGKWRRLPPLTYLPAPQLTHQNLVAGGGGLLCVNVSQIFDEEMLIVCNPLTQEHVMLPPLHSRRNPVLLHLLANPATNSYKVIAAGSSSDTGDGLSQCTEVFDSVTWKWTETGDIPGYDFFLNEYQTGVCKDGILYCVAFANNKFEGKIICEKRVLAYDLEKGEWMPNWTCLLPLQRDDTVHVAQLVECNKDVYLFLEYSSSLCEEQSVQHELIAKLETSGTSDARSAVGKWKIVMKRERAERGLCSYPEYTCVPYGVGKLCIFNTIEQTGVVYDMNLSQREGDHGQELPPPPAMQNGYVFHSLNPLSFTFQLSFHAKCGSPSHAVMSRVTTKDRWDLMVSDSQECGRKEFSILLFPEINCQGNTLNHHEEDDPVLRTLQSALILKTI